MPFDLGNHPARLVPASGLIGEVRVRSAHVIGRATNRTLEQIADPLLKDAVRRKSNGVFDPFSLQIFVHLGIGEAGVGTKINARDFTLIPRHDRLQYCLPSVGAVNIARAQGAAFQIAKLVEHEQRMIAGAGKMPVPGTHLLFAMRRAHARIHIEHDAARRTASMNAIDPDQQERKGSFRP